MLPVVAAAFFELSVRHEGFVPFMYCDNLNLVTTGIGNLIDTSLPKSEDVSAPAYAPALRLPWKHRAQFWTPENPRATDLASEQEVIDEWATVKKACMSQQGGMAYRRVTKLTLTLDDVKELFASTLERFEQVLTTHYPKWDSWPPDAQLALLSMAWAMGPNFSFPKFAHAVNADNPDFATAAKECVFKGGGAAPNSRNTENSDMFMNAYAAIVNGWDLETLYFPRRVFRVRPLQVNT